MTAVQSIAPPMFNWDGVITKISQIVEQDLIDRHITLQAVQPDFDQDCQVPLVFPAGSPSVTVQSVKKFSLGRAPAQFSGTTQYTLHFVYLHILAKQPSTGFKVSQYESAIRQNIGAIFAALIKHRLSLGTNVLIPGTASIDSELQGPKGRYYLGGTFDVVVTELVKL